MLKRLLTVFQALSLLLPASAAAVAQRQQALQSNSRSGQVAHLAASGPGYDDPQADSVLEALADAVAKNDPRTRNLWFDVTTVAVPGNSAEVSALLVKRIRQIGVKRILYGSDAATGSNLRPREAWEAFCRLGLSEEEKNTIARNVAPHLQ